MRNAIKEIMNVQLPAHVVNLSAAFWPNVGIVLDIICAGEVIFLLLAFLLLELFFLPPSFFAMEN